MPPLCPHLTLSSLTEGTVSDSSLGLDLSVGLGTRQILFHMAGSLPTMGKQELNYSCEGFYLEPNYKSHFPPWLWIRKFTVLRAPPGSGVLRTCLLVS